MVEGSPSFERCWRDVLECRAPVTELAEGAHAIVFVRWLLQQAMPYPCFLWGEHWIAARLRISLDSLRTVESGDTRLAEDLRSMRYTGILAEFMGRRWWRGALEDFIWELVGSHAPRRERLVDALTERAGIELEPVELNPRSGLPGWRSSAYGTVFSPETAVPIRPDHWPAFADSAWMDIEEVRADPIFQSMVGPVDRYLVLAADD